MQSHSIEISMRWDTPPVAEGNTQIHIAIPGLPDGTHEVVVTLLDKNKVPTGQDDFVMMHVQHGGDSLLLRFSINFPGTKRRGRKDRHWRIPCVCKIWRTLSVRQMMNVATESAIAVFFLITPPPFLEFKIKIRF